MKKLYFLFVIIFFTLLTTGCTNLNFIFLKSFNNSESYYLKNNSENLGTSFGDISGLDILYDDISGKSLILTGENHGTELNYIIKFNMFKYLHENFGVNYYLDESGIGSAYLINMYIKGKLDSIPNFRSYFMTPLKGTYNYTQENFDFFDMMKKYYKSSQVKFEYIGSDIDHQTETALYAMYFIINNNYKYSQDTPEYSVVSEINNLIISYMQDSFDINPEKSREYSLKQKTVIEKILASPDIFRNILSENDYFYFKLIAQNISDTYDVYGKEFDDKLREDLIYNNFRKVYSYYSSDNPVFYGQWGSFHTTLKSVYENDTNFAEKILSENFFGTDNSILSIIIFYNNSYSFDKNNYNKVLISNDSGYKIQKITREKMTIFRLNEKNSPFLRKNYFNTGSGFSTDYYQYFIFIQNSENASPFQNKF